jgi:His-Xaa-Ser system radical SAM maturase HxsC
VRLAAARPACRDDIRLDGSRPLAARSIGFTGGEPTIEPAAFLHLLRHCAKQTPGLSVHVLSNGRKFADQPFTQSYSAIPIRDLMVGIPLYSSEAGLHDFVVQARGAFDETVKGILNLAANGARIEIRVVLQRPTVPALAEIAMFHREEPAVRRSGRPYGPGDDGNGPTQLISRLVRPCRLPRRTSTRIQLLETAGIYTRIYNHQLCLIDPELWPAAVKSISDWKNDYPTLCDPCTVHDRCAGVFTTSWTRLSHHLHPVT